MKDVYGKNTESIAGFLVEGARLTAAKLAPGLYVVATPIGNLGDITLRALSTLAAVDLIACEDTRVTGNLCRHFGIAGRLVAYHDHNAARQRPRLLADLAAGKAIALVSDAGTPLISDPGYRLVVEAASAGHSVIPVPGASALLAALTVSGLPSDTFHFAGFLPPKEVARRKRLEALAAIEGTLVFYESPQRLASSLADMATVLGGDRDAAVARELTKIFEETRRARLDELAAYYAASPTPKGEVVVLVGPPIEAATSTEAAEALLRELLKRGSVSDAVSEAVTATGLPRRELYRRALALKNAR